MRSERLLEIACFNPESALIAQVSGANRIELCSDYSVGGITPSEQIILETRQSIHIPMHVIIRPRGGDFMYSKHEVEEMKRAITFCNENNIQGIVSGVLNSKHEIDVLLCKELVKHAGAMPVTFHRAIDECLDIDRAVEQLIDCGVKRVLTSGSATNALGGINTLKHLQEKFGQHITIIPGGGIRSSNILQLIQTGCVEYHSAAITNQYETADSEEIKAIKQLLVGG